MKKSPGLAKLEAMLRSSKLVAGGFLGRDRRSLVEIIETDAADVERSGHTLAEIADRMEEITARARDGLGTAVTVGGVLDAWVTDTRGTIVCPWPHPVCAAKTVTTVMRRDTGTEVRWSDLSIHMIRDHGFFEGMGATFRLEPGELVDVIFCPAHFESAG